MYGQPPFETMYCRHIKTSRETNQKVKDMEEIDYEVCFMYCRHIKTFCETNQKVTDMEEIDYELCFAQLIDDEQTCYHYWQD